MLRIYQMWLFIRLVERIAIGKQKSSTPFSRPFLCGKFCNKKKWFGKGKEYNADEALRAYFLARARGYLREVGDPIKGNVFVNDEGFYMTSPTYLINEASKSIASVGSLTAVIIAAVALYISIKNK